MLVEDVVGNLVEAMCIMLFLKGDYYPCLPKYLDASDQKYEVLEGTCFGIANIRFRDAYLGELESHS